MYLGYKELRGPQLPTLPTAEKKQKASTEKENTDSNKEPGLHQPHSMLGWVPYKNATRVDNLDGNYYVTYNIDAKGFRRTPSQPLATKTIYFFGDSFTFGHGVEDNQTFASVISSRWLDEGFKTVNAGVNGYGVTQMYIRFLEVLPMISAEDIVIFTPISKDILRSYKDFAVPAHYLFSPGAKRLEYFPYFDNGEIKLGKLDSIQNRIKGLLFHAPLTGNAFRKIHRYFIGSIDFDDTANMFDLVRKKNRCERREFLFVFPAANQRSDSRGI